MSNNMVCDIEKGICGIDDSGKKLVNTHVCLLMVHYGLTIQ